MSANQPTAAWSGPGDPLVVVAGYLVSPQDGFGEIGRMPNGNLRRPSRIEAGIGGLHTLTRLIVTRYGVNPVNIIQRAAEGDEATPIAKQANVIFADHLFQAHDGVIFADGTSIDARTTEIWAPGSHGARLRLSTVSNGTTALVARFFVDQSGHLLTQLDNVYDIGANGVNRPRDMFLARDLTMGGNALIGTTTPATGNPRLDVVGENSFDLPTMVGAQRIDDLADKWFAIAVRHDAIAEEPFIMIAGLSSGVANTVMYGGGTALVAGLVNAATRHEWYTAADNTTIRGTLSASLTGVGATSLFNLLGNLRIGALSGTNVSVGINDSGGAGFKLLRVPN